MKEYHVRYTVIPSALRDLSDEFSYGAAPAPQLGVFPEPGKHGAKTQGSLDLHPHATEFVYLGCFVI